MHSCSMLFLIILTFSAGVKAIINSDGCSFISCMRATKWRRMKPVFNILFFFLKNVNKTTVYIEAGWSLCGNLRE